MNSANITPDAGGDDILDLSQDDIQTLNAGVFEFVYSNGRRYNIQPRDGEADQTIDEFEQADMCQHVYGLLYGGELSLSPKTSFNRVLDAGAGSGKWALDMGVMYSDATVTGVDLSPIQPSWVPANVSFDVADVNAEWSFDQKFDLIHIQGMAGCIRDWAYLCGQAIDNMTPGGYLEIHDISLATTCDDGTLPSDGKLLKLVACQLDHYQKILRDPQPHNSLREQLERAGFEDIQQKFYRVPTNTWPADQENSELGKYRNLHYREFFEGAPGFMRSVMGYDEADAQSLVDGAQSEVNTAVFMPTMLC